MVDIATVQTDEQKIHLADRNKELLQFGPSTVAWCFFREDWSSALAGNGTVDYLSAYYNFTRIQVITDLQALFDVFGDKETLFCSWQEGRICAELTPILNIILQMFQLFYG